MIMDKFRCHKVAFISGLSVMLITIVSLGVYEHNKKQKRIEAENIRIAAQKKADKQKTEKLKKLEEEMKKKIEEKIKQEKEKKEKQLAEEKEKNHKEEEAKKKEQEAKDSENNKSDSTSSKNSSSKSSSNNENSRSITNTSKGFKNPVFNGCSQVLLVKSPSMSSSSAQVSCYEKTDGVWKCVKSDMYSIIGGNECIMAAAEDRILTQHLQEYIISCTCLDGVVIQVLNISSKYQMIILTGI